MCLHVLTCLITHCGLVYQHGYSWQKLSESIDSMDEISRKETSPTKTCCTSLNPLENVFSWQGQSDVISKQQGPDTADKCRESLWMEPWASMALSLSGCGRAWKLPQQHPQSKEKRSLFMWRWHGGQSESVITEVWEYIKNMRAVRHRGDEIMTDLHLSNRAEYAL